MLNAIKRATPAEPVETDTKSEILARLAFDHLSAAGLHNNHDLLELSFGSPAPHDRPISQLHKGTYRYQSTNVEGSTPSGPSGVRFDSSGLGTCFDFVTAQSMFALMSFNDIRLCLYQTAKVMARNGRFYATFFDTEASPPPFDFAESYYLDNPVAPGPFSYSIDDLERAAAGLGWSVGAEAGWSSPDGQRLACFRRRSRLRGWR